jgi:hypothetical protein
MFWNEQQMLNIAIHNKISWPTLLFIKKRTCAKDRSQMHVSNIQSRVGIGARVANSHRNRTYGLEFMKNIDDVKF